MKTRAPTAPETVSCRPHRSPRQLKPEQKGPIVPPPRVKVGPARGGRRLYRQPPFHLSQVLHWAGSPGRLIRRYEYSPLDPGRSASSTSPKVIPRHHSRRGSLRAPPACLACASFT